MSDEQEIRKETDFWGNEKEVIYQDGKKIGEIRIEDRGGFLGIGTESTKVEYDSTGNEVSHTTREERGGFCGIGTREVSVKRDVDGEEISTLEVEERGGFCGIGSHHVRAERDTNGDLVSESNHERRGDFLGFGGERVRVVKVKEKVSSGYAHKHGGESITSEQYDSELYSSVTKARRNPSNKKNGQTRESLLGSLNTMHIVIGAIFIWFLYGYISPYFSKYPIDFDYRHQFGMVKNIIPVKNNKYLILGNGNFISVNGKQKNGSTPFEYQITRGTPRPYTAAILSNSGGIMWARKNYYDGYISDIVSKNDEFVIVGDGRKHKKEDFISIKKYNSIHQQIFDKKYFLKYTKDSLHWADNAIATPNGYAIYAKVKRRGKNYNCIINFDNSGNMLWEKSFHGRKNDRAYTGRILLKNNYFYFITAFRYSGSIFAGHSGLPAFVSIIKINMNGNKVWSKEYKYDFDIKQTLISDNNIKIIGSVGNHIHNITVNINGILVRNKEFKANDECSLNSLVLTSANNYLIVGETGSFNTDGCIVELDGEGQEIWSKDYHTATVFYGIYKDKGGYIISGIASKWLWQGDNKHWYVMKIKNTRE